jgi:hypothetical protein
LQARIQELEEEVRRISAEKKNRQVSISRLVTLAYINVKMPHIIRFKQNWQRLKELSKWNQAAVSKLSTTVEVTENTSTPESHPEPMSCAATASSTSV